MCFRKLKKNQWLQSHLVGYLILNVFLVLFPSLEIVSEVSSAPCHPPMMTRLLSWLSVQMLEYPLSPVRLRDSVTQSPCCTFHCTQLLQVNWYPNPIEYPPPHRIFPDWTWPSLLSGSGGSSQVEFNHGRNNSAVF